MIDWEKFKNTLAMTESKANLQAWGDSGQAAGQWQQHPAFVWEWAPDDVPVNWTWNMVFEAALKAFFDANAPKAVNAVQLAMWFHLHGNPGGGWDASYAQRFNEYWGL